MTFYIAGTGNTAWFIGTRLIANGHHCKGVYGRNTARSAALATALHTIPLDTLHAMQDNADCCIVAISDSAIPEVMAQLSFTNTVLCHTAGAVPMNVLSQSATHTGVLWPVYSIVKTNLPQHRDIPIVWEANTTTARQVITTLANALSDITHQLDSDKRKWLHLTAVLGNNFTNHLFSICEQVCREQDVPFSILYPIIQQTADRIMTQSPHELQTGPAKRNDNDTMAAQQEMLTAHPLWQQVYGALSASIENMYRGNEEEKGAKR